MADDRYNRGGYRTKRVGKLAVGEEKLRQEEGPIPLDANLLDGASLGPQDPNAFPRADSDVGGPAIEVLDKGGLGVPYVGTATKPVIAGERERELIGLQKEIEDDRTLTPEIDDSEEEELVDEVTPKDSVESPVEQAPEPQETPDDLPSDDTMNNALEEEPEGEEMQAHGEGLTNVQLDVDREDGLSSAVAEEDTEEVNLEDTADEDEDDIEITSPDDEESNGF